MKIVVKGMMCNGCANRVKNALANLGATDIVVDLNTKEVTFAGNFDENLIKECINDLGFDYISGEGF